MSIFGVQALVALCSSISLARRRKHQVPAFDLALALRRIAWRTVIGFLGVAVISALMIWLTAAPGTFGYLFGMILSFLKESESDDAQLTGRISAGLRRCSRTATRTRTS